MIAYYSYPLAAHTCDVPSHSHPAYERHGKLISHTSLLRKYKKYVHDTHLQKKNELNEEGKSETNKRVGIKMVMDSEAIRV